MPYMNSGAPDHDLATQFRRLLATPKDLRSREEVQTIYGHLREIKVVSKLPEGEVRKMAENARYEVHESNQTIYQAQDIATCWYILLSGSLYLEGAIYHPGCSFGQVTQTGRRISDCLILERSEMIVIDYPQNAVQLPFGTKPNNLGDDKSLTHQDPNLAEMSQMLVNNEPYFNQMARKQEQRPSKQHQKQHRGSRLDEPDLDLSGMKETIVDLDSDDEDDVMPSESAVVRDIVRDCLEKEPSERTENDIHILMDFMQHLPAFNSLSHNIKLEMCKVMVFAVVEKAGATVMSDKEEMDSWSVILNGSVDILIEGEAPVSLHLGDAFGVHTEKKKMYHKGTMRTRVDDCQFVCIAQEDYWRIFSQGEASCRKVEEEGEVVMVTEHRVTDGGSRQGQVVIKGTPDRLLDHLMEDHSVIDPTYVEDFLLTYVVFFNKPHDIASKLLKWFERPQLKDKVTRVMLLWVNNHYADFEGDVYMETSMQRFEYLLEAKKMVGQLRLLNMACSAKSKPRIITLQRPSKDSRLDFSICGGKDRGFPIFVSKVDTVSKASDLGLKRGDQILEVNGHSFENITGPKAIDVLMSHAHLCVIVKTNTIGFKEVIQPSIKKTKSNSSLTKSNGTLEVPKGQASVQRSSSAVSSSNSKQSGKSMTMEDHHHQSHRGSKDFTSMNGSKTLPRGKQRIKIKMPFGKSSNTDLTRTQFQSEAGEEIIRYAKSGQEKVNQSNQMFGQLPNAYGEDSLDLNSQVIKVYRGDHTSRFFVLTKDTSAREVVQTAIDAFGITDHSTKSYFLCQVTVTEDGLIKQRRLNDALNNLANRISLNGRYYIKSSISEGPLPDEVAQEIAREANLTLLQLSPLEIAKELSLQDFDLFKNVDSREYIYNLFEEKNERKSKNLRSVEQTTNVEMYWVISEICNEHNITKRVKLLKYFIKVAKFCKDFKNYNSMYALISGLENTAVSRLKNTWERLPQKHDKIFEELKDLMDPSRNMSKYRNMFTGERCYPPLIPWFPIVKKDITFLHLGNKTHVDGLVNFEKLRMIAKEVRRVCKFCAIGYDPYKMDSMQDNVGDTSNVAQSVVSIMGNSPNPSRRGRGSLAMKDPKKAYEEFQTSRRIRQYLEKLSGKSYNEKEMMEMSYNCEPPVSSQNSLARQKKPSSPLPSAGDLKRKEERSSKSSTDSTRSVESNLAKQDSEPKQADSSTPRKKQAPHQWNDDHHPTGRGPLYSESSNSISSRNGSLKSITSIGSRSLPPSYQEFRSESPLNYDDDDHHGQVSMV
ncbi:rap guanine nucleotide exchange factor 6-like isoform X2 [Clytia hemisphaerica]|uniref:Rap guanine nucleotide exchange factor 2 n=1 Tax=Clytia hemisphaerica TaxID=252671 RepID=A0A7M6DLL7_9CNID